MASPAGHALVGLGLAAAIAQATETPSSLTLWLGAIVVSGLPDLDFVGTIFGFASRRVHRHATHSLLVLGGVILLGACAWSRILGNVDPGFGLAWAAALLSHPLVDLASTGPATAARGFGIALFWPLSPRRVFLQCPVVPSAEFTECRSLVEALKAVLFEISRLGPASVFLVLLCGLF